MKHTQASSLPVNPPSDGILDRALGVVEFLRAHCTWDAAQTPASLQRHLLEEAHEVVDAIARNDDNDLQAELGDLLLNVAFQVVLGEERGAFDRAGIVSELESKIRRRHPHLFGLGEAESWESIKARERQERASGNHHPVELLAGIAPGADPLLHAHQLQERVAEIGFDWPDAGGALNKIREELGEVGQELEATDPDALAEEIGDLLFSVVNLARLTGVHAPVALARANAKFIRRFGVLERLSNERGVVLGDASLQELDVLWEEAKRGE